MSGVPTGSMNCVPLSRRVDFDGQLVRTRRQRGATMPQTGMSPTEVGRIGNEIYEQEIRRSVEIPENIGQIIVIDIDSHDYEIGCDVLPTVDLVQARHPNAEMWTKRIGFNAVYAIGGTLQRTAP